MALSHILTTCTANKSAVWHFLCRLASPIKAFLTGTTSWWFSISFRSDRIKRPMTQNNPGLNLLTYVIFLKIYKMENMHMVESMVLA
jgi:hypothetical protein